MGSVTNQRADSSDRVTITSVTRVNPKLKNFNFLVFFFLMKASLTILKITCLASNKESSFSLVTSLELFAISGEKQRIFYKKLKT